MKGNSTCGWKNRGKRDDTGHGKEESEKIIVVTREPGSRKQRIFRLLGFAILFPFADKPDTEQAKEYRKE